MPSSPDHKAPTPEQFDALYNRLGEVIEQRDKAEAALLEARQTLVAIERHQYFIDKTLPAEVKALVRGGREPLQKMARAALGSPAKPEGKPF